MGCLLFCVLMLVVILIANGGGSLFNSGPPRGAECYKCHEWNDHEHWLAGKCQHCGQDPHFESA